MDAEIAARDLSDTFRYNVLPEVIQAIGWKRKDLDFDDLPDHERLLWMVMHLVTPRSADPCLLFNSHEHKKSSITLFSIALCRRA
jgi:hypothetical protein